ncbi:urea permease [Saxophila tyrrhenica]|uniref:Urea permease n=1 Tax=Saxophila tyrrhenica TaxID=1690608 RepID=A0AAV9PB75_9PEZI|nr:urea permease [Saxophila tyrrhenica]
MGTFQILLFALIAIKIKANAPGAHTFPEIVFARHGKIAHITYLFNGLATNMLVGACLVLGGSQVVEALTGMNVYGACFLIPLVVAAYVIAGGLRSTFIADYLHTVVLFIAIMVFGFLMYATSDLVGSISRFYDMLQDASKAMPIGSNTDGSYLAFRSVDGLVFGIDLFAAGFSTVWLDQAYWQRAIASKPETSVRAYILGGVAWYGIPFGFATAMGLGCAALTSNPRFPTYPNPLSTQENGAGLSSPATAITLLGQGGAVLMLVLLFMAVTSSTSAELIAVSSLLTFDVYKTYIKPDSTSAGLVQISHYGIILYALVLAGFCCILNAVGLDLTWLLTILAIMVGGASIPVGLILLWKRMSTVAAVGAPWIGLVCGLIAWFVTTWKRSGAITVATSGDTTNAVAGNITSWGVGFLMSIVLTLAFPAKYSSTDPKHIERSNKIQGISTHQAAEVSPVGDLSEKSVSPADDEKKAGPAAENQPPSAPAPETHVPTGNEIVDFLEAKQMEPMDPVAVKKSERLAVGANIVFGAVAIILVPFTLFGTGYIYSRSFFTGWVVMSFIWVWTSMCICVIYPVVESTGALRMVSRGLWKDTMALFGGKKNRAGQASNEA